MPDPDKQRWSRGEIEARGQRDVARRRARQPDHAWHGLALIGTIGWPIVLLTTGGALLGRMCDLRWGTGVHFTLMLLTLGAALGTWAAFRTARGAR